MSSPPSPSHQALEWRSQPAEISSDATHSKTPSISSESSSKSSDGPSDPKMPRLDTEELEKRVKALTVADESSSFPSTSTGEPFGIGHSALESRAIITNPKASSSSKSEASSEISYISEPDARRKLSFSGRNSNIKGSKSTEAVSAITKTPSKMSMDSFSNMSTASSSKRRMSLDELLLVEETTPKPDARRKLVFSGQNSSTKGSKSTEALSTIGKALSSKMSVDNFSNISASSSNRRMSVDEQILAEDTTKPYVRRKLSFSGENLSTKGSKSADALSTISKTSSSKMSVDFPNISSASSSKISMSVDEQQLAEDTSKPDRKRKWCVSGRHSSTEPSSTITMDSSSKMSVDSSSSSTSSPPKRRMIDEQKLLAEETSRADRRGKLCITGRRLHPEASEASSTITVGSFSPVGSVSSFNNRMAEVDEELLVVGADSRPATRAKWCISSLRLDTEAYEASEASSVMSKAPSISDPSSANSTASLSKTKNADDDEEELLADDTVYRPDSRGIWRISGRSLDTEAYEASEVLSIITKAPYLSGDSSPTISTASSSKTKIADDDEDEVLADGTVYRPGGIREWCISDESIDSQNTSISRNPTSKTSEELSPPPSSTASSSKTRMADEDEEELLAYGTVYRPDRRGKWYISGRTLDNKAYEASDASSMISEAPSLSGDSSSTKTKMADDDEEELLADGTVYTPDRRRKWCISGRRLDTKAYEVSEVLSIITKTPSLSGGSSSSKTKIADDEEELLADGTVYRPGGIREWCISEEIKDSQATAMSRNPSLKTSVELSPPPSSTASSSKTRMADDDEEVLLADGTVYRPDGIGKWCISDEIVDTEDSTICSDLSSPTSTASSSSTKMADDQEEILADGSVYRHDRERKWFISGPKNYFRGDVDRVLKNAITGNRLEIEYTRPEKMLHKVKEPKETKIILEQRQSDREEEKRIDNEMEVEAEEIDYKRFFKYDQIQSIECECDSPHPEHWSEQMVAEIHRNFHKIKRNGLEIPHEMVLFKHNDVHVIKINMNQNTAWTDKALQVIEFVDIELGYSGVTVDRTPNTQVFLLVEEHVISGCAVVVKAHHGYRMISKNKEPIMMAIDRMWILPKRRRHKAATFMMDNIRIYFFPEMKKALDTEHLGFADPTELGRLFIQSYMKESDFKIHLPE